MLLQNYSIVNKCIHKYSLFTIREELYKQNKGHRCVIITIYVLYVNVIYQLCFANVVKSLTHPCFGTAKERIVWYLSKYIKLKIKHCYMKVGWQLSTKNSSENHKTPWRLLPHLHSCHISYWSTCFIWTQSLHCNQCSTAFKLVAEASFLSELKHNKTTMII